MRAVPSEAPVVSSRSPRRYLVGHWSELQVSSSNEPTREYVCFDVYSKAQNLVAGQIDAREIYPRVYQIGVKMRESAVQSGLGLDASITLLAWLFDFRDAHAAVVVTSTENRHLDGLFRLGISVQTASSRGYLRSDEGFDEARWGVIERSDFERDNLLLTRLRAVYIGASPTRTAEESSQ